MQKKYAKIESEAIPVTAARTMAFLTVGMSLGFVLLVYFLFIKDVFSGVSALLVLLMMLAMSVFSSLVALRSIRKKIPCTACGQLYFANVLQMFQAVRPCASCAGRLDISSKR